MPRSDRAGTLVLILKTQGPAAPDAVRNHLSLFRFYVPRTDSETCLTSLIIVGRLLLAWADNAVQETGLFLE